MAYTTIKKPSDYFNTKLYTGNASTQSITGVGFQPDFTWIKNRDSVTGHRIIDAVRGNTKTIYTNASQGEETVSNMMTSFDSDGFSLGNDGGVNGNGNGIASWNWKANGAGSANTDGSISSTVSANTTSRFSIVSYTGTGANTTVGHGLGVTPKMIIVKKRNASGFNWVVQHASIFNSSDTIVALDTTDTAYTQGVANFNGTAAGSSVFTIGSGGNTNDNGGTYIAYCFADVQGYSKFGNYNGNGNADGTFIYTGFKPAFIITKGTGNASSWSMTDSTISTFNDGSLEFFKANENDAESSRGNYDILSNGFKMRTTDADYNGSGNNYIYMAFAEQPLVGDNPATAR